MSVEMAERVAWLAAFCSLTVAPLTTLSPPAVVTVPKTVALESAAGAGSGFCALSDGQASAAPMARTQSPMEKADFTLSFQFCLEALCGWRFLSDANEAHLGCSGRFSAVENFRRRLFPSKPPSEPPPTRPFQLCAEGAPAATAGTLRRDRRSRYA